MTDSEVLKPSKSLNPSSVLILDDEGFEFETQTYLALAHSADTQLTMPLCVDLDGTLIKTDMLLESFLILIKKNPLYLFQCCIWLLHGKAHLKAQIAKRVNIDVGLLPYNEVFMEFLRKQRAQGRPLYLCTATDQRFAKQIASHFGMFAGIFASDGHVNLSSHNKASALKDAFGIRGFDYCGNSTDDIVVWKEANKAIVIGNQKIAAAASEVNQNISIFQHTEYHMFGFSLKKTLRAMRVYQWVKNILIFVPLLTSHQFVELVSVRSSLIAFVSFSLCASSVYLLNDMLDLDADRRHARKCTRPFAAGDLSLQFGIFLMLGLLVTSFVLALLLPLKFMLVLGCYYVLTLAYSFKLKKMLLIDVFALASLYTSRVMAGSAASDIPLSSWLVMFSISIFLSVAFLKRYTELDEKLRAGGTSSAGRSYLTEDISLLRSFGTSAGYLAVIILAIYLNSTDIYLLYSHRSALWGVFALLLFWVSWMWMCAFKGKMHYDPIVFALKDRTSLVTITLVVLCMLIAI